MNFKLQDGTEITAKDWIDFKNFKKDHQLKNNRLPFFAPSQGVEQHQKDLKSIFTTLQKEGQYATSNKGQGFTFIDKKALTKQGVFNNYLTTNEGTQFSPDSVSYELLRRRFEMPNSISRELGLFTFTGKNLRLPLDRTNFGVAIVPENGEFPIATPDTADIVLEPQKLATALRMSGEFFNDADNVAYNSLLDNLSLAFQKAEEDLVIFADGTGLQATANVSTEAPIPFASDTQDDVISFRNRIFQSMRFMNGDFIQPENMVLIAHSSLYPYIGNLGIESVVYTDAMDDDGAGNLPILWVNKNSVFLGLRQAYTFEMLRKDNFMYRLESLERFGMELPYLTPGGLNPGASLSYVDVTPGA